MYGQQPRPGFPQQMQQPMMQPGQYLPGMMQPGVPNPGMQQQIPQQQRTMQEMKKKRPTDKTLSKKIENYVPESKLYMEMQEFERRLDATITRKTLDIQDSLSKPGKNSTRTLRIFLSNLSANQNPEQLDNLNMDMDRSPCWTFKLEGRLLDLNVKNQPANKPRFSSFFKKIRVEIQRDQDMYPQPNLIEWVKSSTTPECDGFEIKRTGDQDVDIKILMYLDQQPDKHKLSPALSALLDMHSDTLPNIMLALWQYIKSRRLHDPEDRRSVLCDEKLTNIFKVPKFMFPAIPELLADQLLPADPVVLNYTVRVDKEHNMNSQAFDVEVTVNDPAHEILAKVSAGNPQLNREIAALDDKICALVQSINLSKLKRDFMRSFADNPINFINQWTASQSRDLEIVLGDTRLNPEEIRQSKLFENDSFKEALFHYLRQKEVR